MNKQEKKKGETFESNNELFEVLITRRRVQERIKKLAEQIERDYKRKGLTVVGVLTGASIFMSDLVRQMSNLDLQIEYMGVSSYGMNHQSNRQPKIEKDLKEPITGKNVLLVEDMADTGYSLKALLELLEARRPMSLKTCVLLSKPSRREVEVPIDYLGFTIPNVWVVGMGMDDGGRLRQLPFVAFKRDDL